MAIEQKYMYKYVCVYVNTTFSVYYSHAHSHHIATGTIKQKLNN